MASSVFLSMTMSMSVSRHVAYSIRAATVFHRLNTWHSLLTVRILRGSVHVFGSTGQGLLACCALPRPCHPSRSIIIVAPSSSPVARWRTLWMWTPPPPSPTSLPYPTFHPPQPTRSSFYATHSIPSSVSIYPAPSAQTWSPSSPHPQPQPSPFFSASSTTSGSASSQTPPSLPIATISTIYPKCSSTAMT